MRKNIIQGKEEDTEIRTPSLSDSNEEEQLKRSSFDNDDVSVKLGVLLTLWSFKRHRGVMCVLCHDF